MIKINKGVHIIFNPFEEEREVNTFNILPVIQITHDKGSFWETGNNEYCTELSFSFEWLMWSSYISFYYNFYKINN